MKYLLYWTSRALAFFILIMFVLTFTLGLFFEPFWVSLYPGLSIKAMVYGLIGIPVTLFTVLFTVSQRDIATRIWEWILVILLVLGITPFAIVGYLFFFTSFFTSTQGVPIGLAFVPIIAIGIPALTVSLLGLVVSEFLALRRLDREQSLATTAPIQEVSSKLPVSLLIGGILLFLALCYFYGDKLALLIAVVTYTWQGGF